MIISPTASHPSAGSPIILSFWNFLEKDLQRNKPKRAVWKNHDSWPMATLKMRAIIQTWAAVLKYWRPIPKIIGKVNGLFKILSQNFRRKFLRSKNHKFQLKIFLQRLIVWFRHFEILLLKLSGFFFRSREC